MDHEAPPSAAGLARILALTTPWDPAKFIEGPEDEAAVLSVAIESGDPGEILAAMKAILRARKIRQRPVYISGGRAQF